MIGRPLAALLFITYLGAAQGPLQFELQRIEEKTPSCVSTFEYPDIISAGSQVARDQMNAGILRTLLRRNDWPASDSGFRSLDAFFDAFMKDYAKFHTAYSRTEEYYRSIIGSYFLMSPVRSG